MADVIVENYRPGVMARLGLSYEDLCETNPGLVYVSLTGFGSEGPWRDRGCYGPLLEAMSSMSTRTSYEGGEPLTLGHALPDAVGGLAGALAALIGLRRRTASGHGAWFDISQLEAYLCLSGEDIVASSVSQADTKGVGNRHPDCSPHGVYVCRGSDEWVAIACLTDEQWGALRAIEDFPVISDDIDVATAANRKVREDVVDELVSSWTQAHDKRWVASKLQSLGVPAFPVMKASDLVADQHLAERGYFVAQEWRGRAVKLPGSPIRSSRQMTRIDGRAPRPGEHTLTVLSELLGADENLLADLLTGKIISSGDT
jgi:crotonobetainyl-CoA:carnitine CoA-transferase CaiB-like acyl-CoA transferase